MNEEIPSQETYVEEQEEIIKTSPERDYLLPGSILISGLLISGSIIYLVGSGTRVPITPPAQTGDTGAPSAATITASLALTSRDVILGDPKAPVTLIEYGDYQCPYCARFFTGPETQIRNSYVKDGKVRMVFRNLPFLGPESTATAAAAECAKDQGKFWAFHDAIYKAENQDAEENSGNLNRALFLSVARDVGMDVNAFTSCVDSKKYAAQIDNDATSAHAAGVESTPSSFVNGEFIQGAQPFSVFQDSIDKALAKG